MTPTIRAYACRFSLWTGLSLVAFGCSSSSSGGQDGGTTPLDSGKGGASTQDAKATNADAHVAKTRDSGNAHDAPSARTSETGITQDASNGGTHDASNGGTHDASNGGTHDASNEGSGSGGGVVHEAGTGGQEASTGNQSDASVSAPPPAVSAGFTHLSFEDDFTTNDTIATTQNASSGYKWYWSYDVTSTPVPWSVNTTATAASISNGNSGGGSNASPNGGILTVTGPGAPNDALITVPGAALNNSHAVLPAEGDGCWSHAYFEAYLQTNVSGDPSTSESNGWPAFWSWSMQGLKGYGFGSSAISTPTYSEIDFFETYDKLFGDQPGNWTATMHQWPADTTTDGNTERTDSNWHTYGCLWTSTGTGTGQVKFYLDNVQVDKTIDTGTGQTQSALEGLSQFLILGTGKNWDLNVDWVRVWQ